MSAEYTRRGVDMTVGSPYKKIVLFAIPLLFSNVFQQLYNTVDSAIVGNYIGTKALAAVGAGFPIMAILFAVFMGLGMASTIMVGRAVGARDYERINLIMNTIYRFSLLMIVPLSLIGFFAAGPILRLLNVPDDGTLTLATQYIQVVFLGMFATVGYNTNAGFFQGLGDSITSLKLLVLATVINIVLDFVFVVPLGWGVRGAAIATVIAQATSWIAGLLIIRKRFPFVKVHLLKLDFDKLILLEGLRMGLPMALQNALFSLGSMAMMRLINSFGHQFMAGFNSANKVDTFVFLPVQSFTNAMTTYTSQNIGAMEVDRLRKGMKSGLILTIGMCVLMIAFTYPLSPYLLKIFGDDPLMIENGLYYLRTVLPFYPLLAILFTLNSVLRGAGQAFMPMATSMVSMLLMRVPSAYLIAHNFGKEYIFYSYALGWLAGCIISGSFFIFGKWRPKLIKELEEGKLEKDRLEAELI